MARMRAWGRPIACCRFEVIALWQVDAQEVVAQQLVGLYPLLPLMRWPQTEPTAVLEQSQRLILEQIPAREARADAYVALRVLSGIAYPLELVEQILQRRDLMLESPVYRAILEEGRQEGRQEGLYEWRCWRCALGRCRLRWRNGCVTSRIRRFWPLCTAAPSRSRAWRYSSGS